MPIAYRLSHSIPFTVYRLLVSEVAMSAERALLTVDEYFALEERTGIKHEYLNGQVYQMSGASIDHNQIVTNIIISLGTKLRGSGCRVFPSDLRVYIEKTGLYTYPDVVITCGNLDLI